MTNSPNEVLERQYQALESQVAEPEGSGEVTERINTPGWQAWARKYFLEGQSLNKAQTRALEKLSDDAPLHKKMLVKHRRLVGFLVPALLFHFCWWSIMIKKNLWHVFDEKYFMSITMVFGSIIAGMTSEGGGAVAFPVMTLAFDIAPSVARDFSLMSQSCGMSAAAFTIYFMRIQLEYHALLFCSFGGLVGIIFGFHVVDPVLTPPQKKMIFVSVFFAFASVLFLINRYHKRRTFTKIPNFNAWKAVCLTVVGICGGIFSSFSGSGLDICCFSILTLVFRISEKIATPTSVILMAGNTMIGFFWRQVIISEVSADAWEYLAVCVPVVVFGAPFGSLVGSHFHRLVLAAIVCLLDVVALVGAWAIIDLTPTLIGLSVGITVGGFVMFAAFTAIGQLLLKKLEETEVAQNLAGKCSSDIVPQPEYPPPSPIYPGETNGGCLKVLEDQRNGYVGTTGVRTETDSQLRHSQMLNGRLSPVLISGSTDTKL